MKTVILSVIVAFLACTFVSCNEDNQPISNSESIVTEPLVSADTALTDWQKTEQVKQHNRAISESQEIPTGTETFNKLVAYIWQHGFTTKGGTKDILCGKQYSFLDSRGNRHAYQAIKVDPVTDEASMDGRVQKIVAYGYKNGTKNQEDFFPYEITAVSVYCPILEFDGTWKCVEEACFGYREFLAKVNKQ